MDKFTRKGGAGDGGAPAKRTKIVLQSRMYQEGSYMKTVCEEVEVTDDEEVGRRLPPLRVLFYCFFFCL